MAEEHEESRDEGSCLTEVSRAAEVGMSGYEGSTVSQAHIFREAKDPGKTFRAETMAPSAFSLQTVTRTDLDCIKPHSPLCAVLQLLRLP